MSVAVDDLARANPRTKDFSKIDARRVLLIKPSSLGDIVHALPVLHGLRRRFPDAHLAWMVASPFIPLVANHPDVDEIIEFDRKRLARWYFHPAAFRAFRNFTRQLKAGQFDLVVDLQGLFRSGYFTWATGAKRRVGFADARELAPMFYNKRLPKRSADEHAVEHNYRVAEALGFTRVKPTIDLAITDEERSRARAILDGIGIAEGTAFAAILPSARWETKQWLPERFSELIDRIAKDRGMQSVVMGAPDERELCGRIVNQCASSPVDISGTTNLRELAAIIEKAAVVICHDSGPMHLAAALDRPMVSILGPTNPLRTGPYGHQESVVRRELDCSPCYLKRHSQCRYDHSCMKGLEVEPVYVRLGAMLDQKVPSVDKRNVEGA
ncbi:MAG: lipopolysaccharide heptosyltransferase I [Phycisphaerae bacterium]|nr:MAG: lipopolysaccharide heptosyltransferase I [Phycisphaerae bacterium]